MQLTDSVFRTNIHQIIMNLVANYLVHIGLPFKNAYFTVYLDELVGKKQHKRVKTCSSEAILKLLEDQAVNIVLSSPGKKLVMVVIA